MKTAAILRALQFGKMAQAAALALVIASCATPPGSDTVASVDEVARFFESQGKQVLTFVGYSGAGYQDEAGMLEVARRILEERDPATTIVNIGATPEGIGAVYGVAKAMGFQTAGIVSTRAKEYGVALSPDVDHVFFVEDATWGGRLEGTDDLAPTSQAIVEVSDTLVGIGGGAIGRDEMLAARQLGKRVTFVPADMNHDKATEKAEKKGEPPPTDFRGAAHEVFAPSSGS